MRQHRVVENNLLFTPLLSEYATLIVFRDCIIPSHSYTLVRYFDFPLNPNAVVAATFVIIMEECIACSISDLLYIHLDKGDSTPTGLYVAKLPA